MLPQVPLEWKWNLKEFLEDLSMKVGLYKDTWKDKDVRIFSFEAEVFKEKRPKQEI